MNLLNVEITTNRLLLKPISLEYKADIFSEFTDEITTYMLPTTPKDISETENFINGAVAKLKQGTDLTVVILDKNSQEFLGCAGIHHPERKSPELGIWLKKSAHGRSYGLEAITALKQWADKHLDYEYLIYPVDKNNIASRRIPEALGGKIAKEYDIVNQSGRVLDIMEYHIDKENKYEVWKNEALSQNFLTGVRGAIPLAAEQIDVILRIIGLTKPKVENFLDLGCGNGILGKAIYQQHPGAKGIFLDISETMLEAAKSNFNLDKDNVEFMLLDFGKQGWVRTAKRICDSRSLHEEKPFDVIVSGFAIHHQPDERKREIYAEIYDILKPGGLFLNLEHVASKSRWGEKGFDELFVDALYSFHKKQGSSKSRQEIDRQYYNREDKIANILAPLETQCQWLSEIGFVDVDCFMKLFEIALFGGLRPPEAGEKTANMLKKNKIS